MHQNPFFLSLLGVIGIALLWYTGVAGYRYYQYITLNERSPATEVSWSVKEFASDEYGVHADYRFAVAGKPVEGHYTFKDKHLNAWAAEEQIKKYAARQWKVWYQSGNVHHSALQKNFPTKECVSALALWGLLLYFLWLGFYVSKYRF